jgi:hypothetical protein
MPQRSRSAVKAPAAEAVTHRVCPGELTAAEAVLTGHHALHNRYVNGWSYYGLTYPDTPAGLAACDAKGESLLKPSIINYACLLSDPVLNVYNLWVEAS